MTMVRDQHADRMILRLRELRSLPALPPGVVSLLGADPKAPPVAAWVARSVRSAPESLGLNEHSTFEDLCAALLAVCAARAAQNQRQASLWSAARCRAAAAGVLAASRDLNASSMSVAAWLQTMGESALRVLFPQAMHQIVSEAHRLAEPVESLEQIYFGMHRWEVGRLLAAGWSWPSAWWPCRAQDPAVPGAEGLLALTELLIDTDIEDRQILAREADMALPQIEAAHQAACDQMRLERMHAEAVPWASGILAVLPRRARDSEAVGLSVGVVQTAMAQVASDAAGDGAAAVLWRASEDRPAQLMVAHARSTRLRCVDGPWPEHAGLLWRQAPWLIPQLRPARAMNWGVWRLSVRAGEAWLLGDVMPTPESLHRYAAWLDLGMIPVPHMASWENNTASTERHVREVAAGAAHELNNPLMVISGRSQMLVKRLPEGSAEQRDAIRIHEQAQRLSDLVTAMHEAADEVEVTCVRVELDRVFSRAVERVRERIPDAEVPMPVLSVNRALWTDLETLSDALAELMINALQASGHRTEDVKWGASVTSCNDRCILWVEDAGSGMRRSVLRHATDPFFSHRTAGRGRGLGLTRAQRAVHAMGGTLRLASEPGRGTRAVIESAFVDDGASSLANRGPTLTRPFSSTAAAAAVRGDGGGHGPHMA